MRLSSDGTYAVAAQLAAQAPRPQSQQGRRTDDAEYHGTRVPAGGQRRYVGGVGAVVDVVLRAERPPVHAEQVALDDRAVVAGERAAGDAQLLLAVVRGHQVRAAD